MDSREFLRRWEAMPDLQHAELIDGVVFCMPSPVARKHGTTQFRLSGWLSHYVDATPGTEAGTDATWVMGPKSVPQPDVALRILPECGGQSTDTGEYFGGAAELVVEVSGSSLSRDLGSKLRAYEQAGVREYVTVLLETRQVVWRHLVRGKYREFEPGEDGWLRSGIFPGLWLDPVAVWNPRKPLRVALDEGLQSAEHAAFVKRLATTRRRGK